MNLLKRYRKWKDRRDRRAITRLRGEIKNLKDHNKSLIDANKRYSIRLHKAWMATTGIWPE
jgi:hypothetical protein